jgi:hypothetical protein
MYDWFLYLIPESVNEIMGGIAGYTKIIGTPAYKGLESVLYIFCRVGTLSKQKGGSVGSNGM